jgi:ubiquinone/menaquinone biosynthesis C-methylase UbiE
MLEVNHKNISQHLELRWMDFDQFGHLIMDLRKAVFVEEQEIGGFMMTSPMDFNGFHLGLFYKNQLISSLSLFLYPSNDPYIQKLGIQTKRPYVVQFSRRAELCQFRTERFAKLLVAHAVSSVYYLYQPDVMFATLVSKHVKLKSHYIRTYGFNKTFDVLDADQPSTLLLIDDVAYMENAVKIQRNESWAFFKKMGFPLPDLAHFITSNQRLASLFPPDEDVVNRYLEPLSLEDELPRLSAQARLLFSTQEEVWLRVAKDFPSINNILDFGCGPGVYFSLVTKLAPWHGKNFTGIDADEGLITYARFAHPNINWKVSSVYKTPFEDGEFDLVNASFLFIHLVKPYLAIKEALRILKPGGLFIISDINDHTFQGPEVIKNLIKAHADIYEGNREIMLTIDHLAKQAGFELLDTYTMRANNTGLDERPNLKNRILKLGKRTMWAMFSFIGQRDEIKDYFSQADQQYLTYGDTISIDLQTKLFRKTIK